MGLLRDRTDDELRASGAVKWALAEPDVLPAWVAEMDFATAEPVAAALHRAVDAGMVGYGPPDEWSPDGDGGVPAALAAFALERWGWAIEPEGVVLAGDVMDAMARTLTMLGRGGGVDGGVIVPTPSYPPFLDVVPYARRELVAVPLDPDAPTAELDLTGIDRALRAGAGALILCNPHNPWGRSFRRDELTAVRDLVERYDALVLADEIHAPLTLPGATHTPYATVASSGARVVTFTSASKAWNLPGLKCAAMVCSRVADAERIRAHPMHPGQSSLGVAATRAALRDGGPWLAELIDRLDGNRALFAALVADRLPRAQLRPLEATYLAFVDARAYGLADPGAVALERGRVWVDHRTWGPGGDGFVRVNLATSPERVEQIVDRLVLAWETAPPA